MQVTTPAKLICDRCGARNTGKNATKTFALFKISRATDFRVIDICELCCLDFEQFLKNEE